jgi:hypothetical protein
MGESAHNKERRDFLRRATLIGVPVIMATVRPRSLWGQTQTPVPKETQSCIASAGTSGCDHTFRVTNGLLGGQ